MEMFGGPAAFERKPMSCSRRARSSRRRTPRHRGPRGPYAHGNDPVTIAYLYAYCGAHTRRSRCSNAAEEPCTVPSPMGSRQRGLRQMSAWYLMSALGLYGRRSRQRALCFGSPLFDRAESAGGAGRKLTIEHATTHPPSLYPVGTLEWPVPTQSVDPPCRACARRAPRV